MGEIKVFCGNSNRQLNKEVCVYLGVAPGQALVKKFSDGETQVEIGENVRDLMVYVLQSTCRPVNENLMELLVMIDALKRASARRITAVLPYYGYARQDRKVKPRVPITARLVADLITAAGAQRVICMDLHSGQIQGYFNIPVDNLYARSVLLKHIKDNFGHGRELCIVSPDAGGAERARAFAKRLEASLAIIDKRRDELNKAQAMNIIGEVRGKIVVLLDDMVDTAGTLAEAAAAVAKRKARKIYACAVHPVLSGQAINKIESSPITQLVVTNTIPLSKKALTCNKIFQVSIASLLGESIKRCFYADSVSSLFD